MRKIVKYLLLSLCFVFSIFAEDVTRVILKSHDGNIIGYYNGPSSPYDEIQTIVMGEYKAWQIQVASGEKYHIHDYFHNGGPMAGYALTPSDTGLGIHVPQKDFGKREAPFTKYELLEGKNGDR